MPVKSWNDQSNILGIGHYTRHNGALVVNVKSI